MDKVDRLIISAKSRIPPKPPIDFSYATTEELLELINEATSKERFQQITYALVDRAARGQLWHK
ncbi:MAG: hypothetical protein KHZ58_12370 [Hungatella hathewayi]|nr:hypothetical protein [Hungatella hathewayi]